jgi:sensor histidine kinase regulating citrate/malate metabolism
MLTLLLVIFFGTFILIDYYENQQKLKLIMLQNKMLEQSMAETEQTFTMWKTSLHDFKHKIMSLMTLAENNDMSGIRDYLEKENKLLGKKLFYYKTGNDTVDTILNIKQKIAENNGFIFMINARVPESCKISSVDFAVILGNLLDNAIEASSNEENPFIEVKIKPIEKFLVIAISNKYTKSDTFLNTTKSDKDFHGIGINSVKKTVKNYDGEYAFKVKDGIFHANIMIPL